MTATKMNAQEIIQFIANAEKKTSVKVTFEGQLATAVPSSVVKLGNVLFGDWKDVAPLLDGLVENQDYVVEQDARNSAVPLLDKRAINARIEPGAIIRDQVEIGDNAVIMMGAKDRTPGHTDLAVGQTVFWRCSQASRALVE